MEFVKQAAKAFIGAAITLVGSLALIVTGDETLADITQAELLVVIGEVLAVFAGVWYLPNKPKSPTV